MACSPEAAEGQRSQMEKKRLSAQEVLDLLHDSDIDLSDGEDGLEDVGEDDGDIGLDDDGTQDSDLDPDFQPSDNGGSETDSETDDSFDLTNETPTTSRGNGVRGRPRSRRGIGGRGRSRAPERNSQFDWSRGKFSRSFPGRVTDLPENAVNRERQDWVPADYFNKYVNTDLLEQIVNATNQTSVQNLGRSLDVTVDEIKKFIGINIMMGCLKYPRIRMYWANSTGVSAIKQAMSRTRFFKIRANLKVVVDINVPEEEKQRDKLWKVRPFLDHVKEACLQIPRPQSVCIDEQMIPFTGHVSVRQYIRGKPYPTGLKNFVLASPSGEVLDFEIFQGKNFFPDAGMSNLSIGGLAVLRLTQSVPANSSLFVDRYFTSIPLLDHMLLKDITVTGTIMKNVVPKNAKRHLKAENEMKREGRGFVNEIVREDSKICIIQWYDNKQVLSASSEFGADPQNKCRRWSKEDKAYVDVPRPSVIKEYNDNMGGVDLSDRMISYYRINARTKKWTIRTILHMLDLSLVNAWLQERQDSTTGGTPKRHLRQFLDFRIAVSEALLYPAGIPNDDDTSDGPPRKRIALPPVPARRHQAHHMPRFVELKNAARCRHPDCKAGKTRIMCTTCSVFLCIRGCFEQFHK